MTASSQLGIGAFAVSADEVVGAVVVRDAGGSWGAISFGFSGTGYFYFGGFPGYVK